MAAGPAGNSRGSAAVLVAEDHADTRHPFALLLRGAGYRVAEAADGAEALALAERPALVLADADMPGLTGFELAAALEADPRTSGGPSSS